MPPHAELVAVDLVDRRSDDDEIRLAGFGFFRRRLATDEVLGMDAKPGLSDR